MIDNDDTLQHDYCSDVAGMPVVHALLAVELSVAIDCSVPYYVYNTLAENSWMHRVTDDEAQDGDVSTRYAAQPVADILAAVVEIGAATMVAAPYAADQRYLDEPFDVERFVPVQVLDLVIHDAKNADDSGSAETYLCDDGMLLAVQVVAPDCNDDGKPCLVVTAAVHRDGMPCLAVIVANTHYLQPVDVAVAGHVERAHTVIDCVPDNLHCMQEDRAVNVQIVAAAVAQAQSQAYDVVIAAVIDQCDMIEAVLAAMGRICVLEATQLCGDATIDWLAENEQVEHHHVKADIDEVAYCAYVAIQAACAELVALYAVIVRQRCRADTDCFPLENVASDENVNWQHAPTVHNSDH